MKFSFALAGIGLTAMCFATGCGTEDHDGDGYIAFSDCNDFDASINPGAPEVCDGIDQNCNDQVDEDGACDADLAGRLDSDDSGDFFWLADFGQKDLTAEDALKLNFSIMPFSEGTTLVGVDMAGGAFDLTLAGGTICHSEEGVCEPAFTYDPSQWTSVELDLNPGANTYALTVNGTRSEPTKLKFAFDMSTVTGFHVDGVDATLPVSAYMNSISLVRSAREGDTSLFSASFDDGTTYEASPGSITSVDMQ